MRIGWTSRQAEIQARYALLGNGLAARCAAGRHEFDSEAWSAIGDEGVWDGVCAPGGGDEAWWDFTAALDGLSSTLASSYLPLSIIAQAGMVRGLQVYGSEEQKERYLPAIKRGRLSATAIAEPETGTDVRSIKTTLTPDGVGFRLNGRKYNIAHAPVADFTMVVCNRVESESNCIALVIVDNDTPGVNAGPMDRKMGNIALPTGSINFDDVCINADQILGSPIHGLRQLVDIISLGRLYYGLVAANLMKPFLETALKYVAGRKSFQDAIINHQYVQRRLTDIRIAVERGRWVAFGALGQLLSGHPDALLNCSVAKLVGTNDLIKSALDLVKLYGSVGYHEGPITDLMRDALGFASVGGTEEMHRKNIFNQMLRVNRPMQPRDTETVRSQTPEVQSG